MAADLDQIWNVFDSLRISEGDTKDTKDETSIYECKFCDNGSIVEDKYEGIVVCTNCGSINEQYLIDQSAEWNFGPEEAMYSKDPSRCGGPVNYLLEKSSMSTMMTYASYKTHGNLKRLHQQTSMDYVERSRYHVFEEINKMAVDKGNLPQVVVELSKYYYMEMSKKRLSRGAIRKGLIACCIYYACKQNKVTRSTKEISEMCNVSTSDINRCVKIFKEHMDQIMTSKCHENTKVDDLYSRVINKLGLDRTQCAILSKKVNHVAEKVEEHCLLNGKTPTAISATIVYYCCLQSQINITKKQIVDNNSVSNVTLNKLYSILTDNADLIK